MILAALLITIVDAGFLSVPAVQRFAPELFLIAAIWSGLRADETGGVRFAVLTGLGAGCFTAGPICLPAFFAVLAATLASTLQLLFGKTREARLLLTAVTLLLIVLARIAWQSFGRSHNVVAWSVAGTMTKFFVSLFVSPVVFALLDKTRFRTRI